MIDSFEDVLDDLDNTSKSYFIGPYESEEKVIKELLDFYILELDTDYTKTTYYTSVGEAIKHMKDSNKKYYLFKFKE